MDVLWWQSAGTTLTLIALAEVGDKSQLVCMVLAARHGRARPVLFGAVAAFSLLNAAAVLFGAALGAWLPQTWVLAAMAVLFAIFGIQYLLHAEDEQDQVEDEVKGHGLFVATFLIVARQSG